MKKKECVMVPHSNSVKPYLSDENKLSRLLYAVEQIEKNQEGEMNYKQMYNVVHLDEKWFYLCKVTQRWYIVPNKKCPK